MSPLIVKYRRSHLAHGSRRTNNEREELLILSDECNGGQRSVQPAIEAMSNNAAGQVLVALELLEVCPHVGWRPRVISGDALDVLPIALEWVSHDHCIVRAAASQSSRARVQQTKRLCAIRGVLAGVQLAVGLAPCDLGVLRLAVPVLVVLDVEVPSHLRVGLGVELPCRDAVCVALALVVSGFHQEDFEAGHGQTGGQRSSARAGANDHIVVLGFRGGGATGMRMNVSLGAQGDQSEGRDCLEQHLGVVVNERG